MYVSFVYSRANEKAVYQSEGALYITFLHQTSSLLFLASNKLLSILPFSAR